MLKAILGMTLIIAILLVGILICLYIIDGKMKKKRPVYRSYRSWDDTGVRHVSYSNPAINPSYNYAMDNNAVILARLRDARSEIVRLNSQIEEKCKKLGTLDWQNHNLRNEIEELKNAKDFTEELNNYAKKVIEKSDLELTESKKETDLWHKMYDSMEKTYQETENECKQLRAYKKIYDDLVDLPNCNTCGKDDCPFRPDAGGTIHANCPIHISKSAKAALDFVKEN